MEAFALLLLALLVYLLFKKYRAERAKPNISPSKEELAWKEYVRLNAPPENEASSRAMKKISEIVENNLHKKSLSTHSIQEMKKDLLDAAKEANISDTALRYLLVKEWRNSVQSCLTHGMASHLQTSFLTQFKNAFALTKDELDRDGSYTQLEKSKIIQSVMEGRAPEDSNAHGAYPVNLQKDEKIIWVFQNVDYLEDKIRRTYVGGSQGFSVRVARGVYLRGGSHRGEMLEEQERVYVDSGLFLTTNKNLYFVGQQKSLRIPYKKIVSFLSFSDAVGVVRDTATAKPQIFVTGDGWFSYNLVTGLANLAK